MAHLLTVFLLPRKGFTPRAVPRCACAPAVIVTPVIIALTALSLALVSDSGLSLDHRLERAERLPRDSETLLCSITITIAYIEL